MGSSSTVAILLFDGVEVLDCCGPFEVFATAVVGSERPFKVVTVAEEVRPVAAVGGLKLMPDYDFRQPVDARVLVLPGGVGRNREMHNRALLDWVALVSKQSEIVMSVCTGAFFLAQLGKLDGLRVTTHHSAHDELAQNYPTVVLDRESRFVDHGPLLTAAGISAGIDASLHVVGRLYGSEVALKTAARMEYPWKPSDLGTPVR